MRVPKDFLVHVSGRQRKASRSGNEQTIRAEQRPGKDGYPFVIAGRYSSLELKAGQETVHLWTRSQQKAADLQSAATHWCKRCTPTTPCSEIAAMIRINSGSLNAPSLPVASATPHPTFPN